MDMTPWDCKHQTGLIFLAQWPQMYLFWILELFPFIYIFNLNSISIQPKYLQTVSDALSLCAALAHRHKRSKAQSRKRRLQIALAESFHLWTITVYELLLWAKSSMLVQWITTLLSFVHWDTSGLHAEKGTEGCNWWLSGDFIIHYMRNISVNMCT